MSKMNTIGIRIADARKQIQMSQANLAEKLFISPQAVGKWERGESMPDITTFERLAEILQVDLNYFSSGHRPDIQSSTVNEHLGTEMREPKKKLTWDLSHGNYTDSDFSGLKNLHEKMSSCNLQRNLFIKSDLSGLLLKTNNVERCDFSFADLCSSHIQSSHLDNNVFKGALFREVKITKSYFMGCDFSEADFWKSDVKASYFEGNLFKGSLLKETNFFKSYFKGCDLSGSDFSGTELKSGGFEHNTVKDAIWKGTSFIGTQLRDIIFEGILEDCYFENCSFDWVKFENANLTNTFFKNNSFKRMKFLNCTSDPSTYGFLKNGGADLTGLSLANV